MGYGLDGIRGDRIGIGWDGIVGNISGKWGGGESGKGKEGGEGGREGEKEWGWREKGVGVEGGGFFIWVGGCRLGKGKGYGDVEEKRGEVGIIVGR